MLKKKILIVSHTSELGGAESALLNLVDLLLPQHDVEVLLPRNSGELIKHLAEKNVLCHFLPAPLSLPNVSNAFLYFSQIDFAQIADQLKPFKYDYVISNTIAIVHGIFIARALKLPHITYAHELLSLEDLALAPNSMSIEQYVKIIEDNSDCILCCSGAVKQMFQNQNKCLLLYPHKFSNATPAVVTGNHFDLLVIGIRSIRKNAHFAITAVKALRNRGNDVKLHIIGPASSGDFKLQQQLAVRNEQDIFFYNHTTNPHQISSGKKITLVCATVEAFGLTITESLQQNIPVVASKSNGPEELLPKEALYNINDLDGCVRAIEHVIKDYSAAQLIANQTYAKLSGEHSVTNQLTTLLQAMQVATTNFVLAKPLSIDGYKKILQPPIDLDAIVDNLSICLSGNKTKEEIKQEISNEQKIPGSAIADDIKQFDVVPFGMSSNLNSMYKNGLGLAVELAATYNDAERQQMAAYILTALNYNTADKKTFRVLAMGDGLGVDSIRLAACGYAVDYMDYDSSLMSEVARKNYQTAKKTDSSLAINFIEKIEVEYDAVICLEVIEHVDDVVGFISVLSTALRPGGMLFISDCFDGIRDRWPTHLYSNEKYAGMLPLLLAADFSLEASNDAPNNKPYFFRKRSKQITAVDLEQLMKNRSTLITLVENLTRLGF